MTNFTATEARKRFFELLRLASAGEKPTIVKTNTGTRFTLTLKESKQLLNSKKLIAQWDTISMKLPSPLSLKTLIASRRDATV